ncbi:hypothetical protein V2J09_019919 [Rumex salicifolius]
MNLRHCIYPDYTLHEGEGDAYPDDHLCITTAAAGSLQSNLSLQTLPSVLSLSLSPAHYSSPLHPPPSHLITLPSVSALALSGNLLYAASGHLINVYHSTSLSLLHSFNSNHPSSGSVKSISFSASRVFTAHQDSKIRVWSPASNTHRLVAVLPTLSDRLLRLPLPANYVQVRRHKKQLWLHHNDAVSCLHASTNLLYSVSWDKTLKIWRLSDDLRCLESLPAHEDAVNAVVVSPDGVVYTGSADSRIRVWARRQGDKKHGLVATLERHKSAVNALALSSDGKVLFSGACDRSILVWEREDSARYMVVAGALRGHSNAILCVLNVSDFLLSGSADRTVRIWRRGMDGHFCCLSVLEGHLKPVKSLVARCQSLRSTSADEEPDTTILTVFSGSLDGQIRVWNLNL